MDSQSFPYNKGWVNVGIDHDTSEFAVVSIRRWWREMGSPLYPDAKELLITADGGGSNGSRVRLWKLELQKLADELGMAINVCHFPPGTSKWNKIEHKMYYHRPKRRPKSPDKKGPLIEKDAVRRLTACFMKRLSYSCSVPC